MAHSVINAPEPKDEQHKPSHSPDAPKPGNDTPVGSAPAPKDEQPAGSATGGVGRPAATPSSGAASNGGAPVDPGAQPVKTPSTGSGQTRTHSDHRSRTAPPPSAAPAVTEAAAPAVAPGAPTATPVPSAPKTRG
jgi:hypothetical protein